MPFVDPGASAYSAADGNLTQYIVVTGVLSVDNTVLGQYLITYNVSSVTGHASTTLIRKVSVIDTIAPVIVLKGNATTYVQGATKFVDPGVALSDNYDNSVVLQQRLVTFIPNAINTSMPAGSSFTIVYSVNDTSNNQATPATRTVVIVDTIPPVITVNGRPSVVVEAATAYADAGAFATDTLDGTDAVATTNSVNLYPSYTPQNFTVVYAAQDRAGNNAVPQTRTVLVRDTTPPVITVAGNQTVTVEAATFYVDAGASATDTLDGTDAVSTYNPVNLKPQNTPALYTIVYSAADRAGNIAANKTRQVTVVDTTAPVLALIGNASMTLQGGYNFTDPYVSATDSLDGDLTSSVSEWLIMLPVNVVQQLLNGSQGIPSWAQINQLDLKQYTVFSVNSFVPSGALYIIVYSVVDQAGNAASINRTVLLVDTLPPVIYLMASQQAQLQGAVPPIPFTDSQLAVIAIDAHDGNITSKVSVSVSSSRHVSGGLSVIDTSAPLGTIYTLTYTVTDAAGNVATPVSRNLTLVDTIPPAIEILGYLNTTVRENDDYHDDGADAFDEYEGNVTSRVLVFGVSDVNTTIVGSQFNITYLCTDEAGNTGSATRAVTVVNAVHPAAGSAASQSIIIGAVIGGILALALVVLLLFIARRRSSSTKSRGPIGLYNDTTIAFQNPLIDTAIESQRWYHGNISREECEERFKARPTEDGNFLVRFKSREVLPGGPLSTSVLSFVNQRRLFHCVITDDEKGAITLDGVDMSQHAQNVIGLIAHLKNHREVNMPTVLTAFIPRPEGSVTNKSSVDGSNRTIVGGAYEEVEAISSLDSTAPPRVTYSVPIKYNQSKSETISSDVSYNHLSRSPGDTINYAEPQQYSHLQGSALQGQDEPSFGGYSVPLKNVASRHAVNNDVYMPTDPIDQRVATNEVYREPALVPSDRVANNQVYLAPVSHLGPSDNGRYEDAGQFGFDGVDA